MSDSIRATSQATPTDCEALMHTALAILRDGAMATLMGSQIGGIRGGPLHD